jgi:type III secretion protein V
MRARGGIHVGWPLADTAKMSSTLRLLPRGSIPELIQRNGHILLVAGVLMIVSAFILPLPVWLLDTLVAINIAIGIGLLLMAIYIPTPTAFASFPNVLLITTLFRLALSIATTRAILLHAEAGNIINAFGDMVAGGNLVVGLVVFIIITVVQFIVVAKGAERVAEVAARFSLDAMPGKQLSIDSDLRSGMIDKDEAKRKRKLLELESQLHGSLDGAMKYVKGDAIASIIIIIVNLLAGLAIGVLMKGQTIGQSFTTYSILTVGEGMVAQIPALLAAFSAGLIVTRTPSEANENLGSSISGQIFAQPKVFVASGFVACLLMLVPGFPVVVFAVMGIACFGIGYLLKPAIYAPLLRRIGFAAHVSAEEKREEASRTSHRSEEFAPISPITLSLSVSLLDQMEPQKLNAGLEVIRQSVFADLGVVLPQTEVVFAQDHPPRTYRLSIFGVPVAHGELLEGYWLKRVTNAAGDTRSLPKLAAPISGAAVQSGQHALGEWVPQGDAERHAEKLGGAQGGAAAETPSFLHGVDLVLFHVKHALTRHASQFLGIQEVNQLLGRVSQQYPDLVKESVRVLPPQRIADVLKRLVEESISIRNLRDILESLAEWGAREKDIVMLTEYVRLGLKRYLSDKYAGNDRRMSSILLDPEVEDHFRRSLQVSNSGTILAIDPETAQRFLVSLRSAVSAQAIEGRTSQLTVLTAMDIRRYVRKLVESDFPLLPVLSYGELETDIQVNPAGRVFW